MPAQQQQYLAGEVAMWLQLECGGAWTFLGCHNLTGISVPRGDTNPVYCRVGKNKFAIQRTWRGTPGLGSATIVAYDTVINYIQELQCAYNLAVLHSASGADDDPFNYDYLYYYNGMEITSEDTDTHVVGQTPDDQTVIMLSMPSTFRERLKVKTITSQSIDVSALTTNRINSVSFCDEASCDNFGNLQTVGCRVGYMTTNGTTARILKTIDGGGTWTAITSPFTDADHHIGAIACDEDTVLVANAQSTAYAYSWDAGVTFSEVLTPTEIINDILIMGGTRIWMAAQGGVVYYSSNRGATIAEQNTPTTNSLNSISGADTLNLYAVGDSNTFIYTEDGGNTWSARTGPAAAIFPNDLYKILAIPGTDIIFVGDEQGNLYKSEDKGVTWSTVLASNSNLAGGIRGLVACDCNVVMVIGNDTDPYFYAGSATATAYQSVDGGNSWRTVALPTNTGVFDLFCCDVNTYWAVGEAGFASLITAASIRDLV